MRKRPLPKSLDLGKNFKPLVTLFCRDLLQFSLFFLKDIGQKKCFFGGSKTAFLGQELDCYMVYIAYCTELYLQI